MSKFLERIKERAKADKKTIVLAEGEAVSYTHLGVLCRWAVKPRRGSNGDGAQGGVISGSNKRVLCKKCRIFVI